jgi:glycerol-3-phosphate dehydrogenase
MDRKANLDRLLARREPWDLVVIGGGATGVGIALDARLRGMDVALIERFDFGKGTSSRSTKLVHGGVRYLQQAQIGLVRDALRERTLLRQNAPHVVHARTFAIPCRSRWQQWFYGLGMKVYDMLAGRHGWEKSRMVSGKAMQSLLPTLDHKTIRYGVLYSDGQFDDSRLLIDMACEADRLGACLVNYVAATGLIRSNQKIQGVQARDSENGQALSIAARAVVNAAGPFCDEVRRMASADITPIVAASQGVHLVLDRSFLPGDTAVIVPKTSDGRVIFMIPWLDTTLIGTTDTPLPKAEVEPQAQEQEIEFLLKTAGDYLSRRPRREDVRSLFTGIRPLVQSVGTARTASLSRDHLVKRESDGFWTVTGGKWTTVRKMADDAVQQIKREWSPAGSASQTKNHPIPDSSSQADSLLREHPEWARRIAPDIALRICDIRWAVSHQMARQVEDVLARRSRLLLQDARIADRIAREVAREMADALGHDASWIDQQMVSWRKIVDVHQIT